jgi:maltooligosyltrehalose trehalohydrolase
MSAHADEQHSNLHEHPAMPVAGTTHRGDGSWEFVLWAPKCAAVTLHLWGAHTHTGESAAEDYDWRRAHARHDALAERSKYHDPNVDRFIEMHRDEAGYFRVTAADVPKNCLYTYRLKRNADDASDFVERPDPASRLQPEGVHGPSQVVDVERFAWTDQKWKPGAFERSIFYEVHVGTFSPEGTLDGIIKYLPELADLGVTTIELMPLAQCPGMRNWGYDGVYQYAVQGSYGGPRALQRFVDAAHANGLAVALDVVYNHFGPEGNYLSEFGPYFTERYSTPWGGAINFDEASSDPVREFFIGNALFWIEHFHVDVLRLDAIQEIFDFGAIHFLAELQHRVEEAALRLGREVYLVGECDLNDSKLLRAREIGGYGMKAQWNDDFHHSLHTLLTPERTAILGDYGSMGDLATVIEEGWLYSGQYSKFRKRSHGNSARGLSRSRLVVCSQNHDQIGNRARGERISLLVDFEAQKLAAGVNLLSPFTPLLFMGEEEAERTPFLYFTEHGDESLIEAVRTGRREEFGAHGWHDDVADPQELETFAMSTLRHANDSEPHITMRKFYKTLIRFRKENELWMDANWQVGHDENLKLLTMVRLGTEYSIAIICNFGEESIDNAVLEELTGFDFAATQSGWEVALDSASAEWRGPKPDASRGEIDDLDRISVSRKSALVLRRKGVAV